MTWVAFALLGLVLAGIKGFWLKRTSERIPHHQHVNLLSMIVTIVVGLVLALLLDPTIPQSGPFIGLVLLAGIAYAVTGVLSSVSQHYVTLSVFNTCMRMAMFPSILFFFVVLGERPSIEQWSGIVGSVVPLVALSVRQSSAHELSQPSKGLVPLLGAMLGLSGQQILNKIAVSPRFFFAVDSIVFIVGVNIVSVPVAIGMILAKRERVRLTRDVVRYGMVAGLLNVGSFGCYLQALRLGPATIVVAINAYHVLISSILADTFPKGRERLGLVVIILWSAGCIALLIWGTQK